MKQRKYSGDMPAHATVQAHPGHAHKHPAPKVHPAYQALYGQPAEPESDLNNRISSAFMQLSDRNQDRALAFVQALVDDDQATVDRMKREVETELAYLQRQNAGGES